MRRLIAIALMALFGLLSTSAASAAVYERQTVNASYVHQERVYLTGGITYTFETKNLSVSGDTIMHLWSEDINDQVAWDDDGGVGLASKIVYTPTSSGAFRVIVRAFGSSDGTCDLYQNNSLIVSPSFAGVQVVVDSAGGTLAAMNTVHTALSPGGVKDTYLYGLDGSANLRVFNDDYLGRASRFIAPVAIKWIVVATYSASESGQTSLIKNDSTNDSDLDGLGAQLEASLCTCDSLTGAPCGWSCSDGKVINPQDTDNDGIRDDYEVLGRKKTTSPGDFPQHLPAWGANPLRKDVFVEVDTHGAHPTSGPGAESSADTYIRPNTAALLNNRDGSNGVVFHFDIGRDNPSNPAETTYGNWGGHTSGLTCGTHVYDNPSTAHFVPSRRGIFRYALACDASGGGKGWAPGPYASYGADLGAADHEHGHNLGLQHWGKNSSGIANSKPNYPSIMNYSFNVREFSFGTFADINATTMVEHGGISGVTSCSQISHLAQAPFYFTLQQAGAMCHIDWNRDGVIAPQGTTVMASPSWIWGDASDPELGRYYWQWHELVEHHDATASPSIARVANRLVIAYSKGTYGVHLRHTTDVFGQGCSSEASGCASFSDTTITYFKPDIGVGPLLADVPALSGGGRELLLIWVRSGALWWSRLDSATLNPIYTNTIGSATGVVHEPSLAWNSQGQVTVYYRTGTAGSNGAVMQTSYNPTSGTWSYPTGVMQNGWQLQARAVVAAGSMPGPGSGTRTFLILDEENGSGGFALRWYELSGASATALANTNLDSNHSAVMVKRGDLAFRARGIGNSQRLYFVYIPNEDLRRQNRIHKTQELGPSDTPSFQPVTRYDNRWQHQYAGSALLGWHGHNTGTSEETNLRMAHFFRRGHPWHPDTWHTPQLIFRPMADSLADITLKDTNDWEVMSQQICNGLHNNGGICLPAPGFFGYLPPTIPAAEVECPL